MEATPEQTVQLRYFDFALQTIMTIPIFNGERGAIENFIKLMDAACAVAQEVQVAESVKTCLGFQFLNRISPEAQREARVNINMTWTEARTRLKNRYGGLQRPLTGHVWKILTMDKGRSERTGDYAGRMCEEVRLLKRRIEESGYDETESEWRAKIYEELAIEALRRNVPEQLRRVLRSPTIKTLEEANQVIEDEELSAREYRANVDGAWTEVRPRPTRMVRRTQPSRPQEVTRVQKRESPRWAPRAPEKERKPFRQRRPCWECGEEGHFARECPYIYRRDRERRRDSEFRRYEPMEVNAQYRRNRRGLGDFSEDESTTSETEQSIISSRSNRTRKDGSKARGDSSGEKDIKVPETKSYADVARQ